LQEIRISPIVQLSKHIAKGAMNRRDERFFSLAQIDKPYNELSEICW